MEVVVVLSSIERETMLLLLEREMDAARCKFGIDSANYIVLENVWSQLERVKKGPLSVA